MFEQLSDVFLSAAFKYLTAVDADKTVSHQHEIGGLIKAGFGQWLGTPNDGSQKQLNATMVYLDEDASDPLVTEDIVTWYDARFLDSKRSPEWRLYYKSNEVTDRFQPGDFLLIALANDNSVLMIFCKQGSEYEEQIRALFGVREKEANKKSLTKITLEDNRIAVPIKLMFARYGIEVGKSGDSYLSKILEKFGPKFPKTREFSSFARAIAQDVCPVESPDRALVEWMETEESAFRQLEKHIVQEKLKQGFGEHGDDVDEFVRFSLSVQNRRKSRSGHAFENHIEEVLESNKVRFERGAKTEGKQKPDFLFPDSASYQDPSFSEESLRILGAKTTCKDRWRQVLAEAQRIEHKHLITLEPAISEAQTDQMKRLNLQLVVPEAVQSTYQDNQVGWLISFKEFLEEVTKLQS